MPLAEIVMEKRGSLPCPAIGRRSWPKHLEKKDRHELRRKLRRAEQLPRLRWYFRDRGEVLEAEIAQPCG